MAQFSQEFFPKERVIMPTASGYQAGVVVNKFMTHGGEVEFSPNIFLNKTRPLNMNASSFKSPAVGTMTSATVKTGGTLPNGTYKYRATFNNEHGESIPTDVSSAVVVADGKGAATVVIANPTSTAFPVHYIRLYRTEANGNNFYEVGRYAVASPSSGATTTIEDTGAVLANTYTAFMGEMSPEIIAFKQLAPLMKMDLATLGPVIRWMILLYGVPIIYAPKKWMRFTNIKADVPGFIGN